MIRFVLVALLTCSTASAMDRLPTGARLDAIGRSIAVGNMPLAFALAPDGRHAVVSLSGYKEQGLQVVDLESGAVIQTIEKHATFLGLAFAGDALFASGGEDNVVYAYRWSDARLTDERPIAVSSPAGLAVSGRTLYVAEQLKDDIAVIDLETSNVVQRFPTDHYPYAIVTDGKRLFVSAWGANTVSMFRVSADGKLAADGRLVVGRHPSALLLDGSHLYVALASMDEIAIVDTKTRSVRLLKDRPPGDVREGSTPNALAVAGHTLYVAEADNNAVAMFDTKTGALLGRIPTDWYPLALIAQRDRLLVLNGKGAGTAPNPLGIRKQFVLSTIEGSIRIVPLPAGDLAALTKRVAAANNWNVPRVTHRYPPFKHVVYVIKENRTYDQVFGDIAEGDGDRSLLFFGHDVTPNQHALASRFGLFDHFFVNAEVSSQGHLWSDAAYSGDFTEKTVQSIYSDRRPHLDEGETDEPAEGFLWDRAIRKGISLRVYGEYAQPRGHGNLAFLARKKSMGPDLDPDYPNFNLTMSDQHRADVWISKFDEFVRDGNLPALEIVQLPRDHTGGGKAGFSTPRACVADNDLALGRMIEAVSKSPYWRDTVFFVLEDDAQNGADHIDSHRSLLLVVSAYNRSGVRHRFVNTTDVVATIEQILGLEPMSQFDHYARPLADVFSDSPDLTPYEAVKPEVPLDEVNPPKGPAAEKSSKFDLTRPDAVDDAKFNEVLWEMVKGH